MSDASSSSASSVSSPRSSAPAGGAQPPFAKGRAGWVEVQILEARRITCANSRLIIELGSERRETGTYPYGTRQYNETVTLPLENVTDNHVYIKVLSMDVLGSEHIFGRASIPLKFLMNKEHSLSTWIELLPPHIGELPFSRGSKVRALSPAIYKRGMAKTMEKRLTDPGWIQVKVTWHDAPGYFEILTTDWDWTDAEPADALDWYGNLYLAHGSRIGAALTLPASLRALRAAPLNTRLLAVAVYMMICLTVEFWMLPLLLFASVLANSLYYHKYEEGCVSMIPLYEEANEIPAPTIFETLSVCKSGAMLAPGGALTGQTVLAEIASHVERATYVFTIGDDEPAATVAFSILFAGCAGLSALLFYIPVRVLMLPLGAVFLLVGAGPPQDAAAAASPRHTGDTSTAAASPSASVASSPRPSATSPASRASRTSKSAASADDGDDAAPLVRSAPARPGPLLVFLRNVWLYTPDWWETVHRRVSRMQMVSRENVPATFTTGK